jgi:hypothetical protein
VNDAEWRRVKERLLLPQKQRPGAYLDELRRRAEAEREKAERKVDKQMDLFNT